MTRTFKVKLDGTFFTVVKQFGTGIIISTALVHVSPLVPQDSELADLRVADYPRTIDVWQLVSLRNSNCATRY